MTAKISKGVVGRDSIGPDGSGSDEGPEPGLGATRCAAGSVEAIAAVAMGLGLETAVLEELSN